jgi:hypothetical protein
MSWQVHHFTIWKPEHVDRNSQDVQVELAWHPVNWDYVGDRSRSCHSPRRHSKALRTAIDLPGDGSIVSYIFVSGSQICRGQELVQVQPLPISENLCGCKFERGQTLT